MQDVPPALRPALKRYYITRNPTVHPSNCFYLFIVVRIGKGIIAAKPNGQACHGGRVLGPWCQWKQVAKVCERVAQ